MSKYKELVDEFFTRYEHPVIEPFILGFSGIDPPLKSSLGTLDHEALNNILGGDAFGHFHISKEQLDWISAQMNETYPPSINPNQSIYGTAEQPIDDYSISGTDVRP